ncbi:hypothetical protein PLICBS_010631, partial [Purpureocillium lilacinum]|uniref:uncharacterized protein n=1 Tax=Purpureocillium lilacinum TaxID=33203 RepID=UPI00208BDE1F
DPRSPPPRPQRPRLQLAHRRPEPRPRPPAIRRGDHISRPPAPRARGRPRRLRHLLFLSFHDQERQQDAQRRHQEGQRRGGPRGRQAQPRPPGFGRAGGAQGHKGEPRGRVRRGRGGQL